MPGAAHIVSADRRRSNPIVCYCNDFSRYSLISAYMLSSDSYHIICAVCFRENRCRLPSSWQQKIWWLSARLRGNIIGTVFLYCKCAPTSSIGTVDKKQFMQPCFALFVFLCFFRMYDLSAFFVCCFTLDSWVISLFVLALTLQLKWDPFELFAPSSLLRVRSWLHPFLGPL